MTLNTDLMFSSKTEKWDTPQWLVGDLATVFDWDLDVCAERPNVCYRYYTEAQDGLDSPWGDLNWCNPPYGRGDKGCAPWLERATTLRHGKATVFLIPARTDTRWWHNHVWIASQIVFIKGRLTFGEAENSAPFPSAFMVIGEINPDQRDKLASYGWSIYQPPIDKW